MQLDLLRVGRNGVVKGEVREGCVTTLECYIFWISAHNIIQIYNKVLCGLTTFIMNVGNVL